MIEVPIEKEAWLFCSVIETVELGMLLLFGALSWDEFFLIHQMPFDPVMGLSVARTSNPSLTLLWLFNSFSTVIPSNKIIHNFSVSDDLFAVGLRWRSITSLGCPSLLAPTLRRIIEIMVLDHIAPVHFLVILHILNLFVLANFPLFNELIENAVGSKLLL